MMFRGRKLFNASFDAYADNYQQVRPGYPAALLDDIKAVCGLSDESRILEIGAGSGIATIELAKFKSSITALEPGENLIKIAKEQLRGADNVEFVCDTFEDFKQQSNYDAVMAFTAFHWLSKRDMFGDRISSLLAKRGKLVLVWNSFFQSESDVVNEVNRTYKELLPDVYPDDVETTNVNAGVLNKLNTRIKQLAGQDEFHIVFQNKYVTKYHYDHETYPKLLATFPRIIDIADNDRRNGFLERISETVKRHGKITVPVLSSLIILEKKTDFISEVSEM